MRRFSFAGALIAFVIAAFACAAPAQAQATRTWVSGVGDDANPCSRTAPCKTFAGAISKTAASGEINCLDPGGFGGVTITKAIAIKCDGVSNGGVLVSGTNGVTVAAGTTDVVYLQGLDFECSKSGTNGVQVNSGARVYIIQSTIRDFTGNGVNVTSTTAGTHVFIQNSVITNNGGGVNVQGSGVSNVADLANTLVDGNTSFAVQANTGNSIALLTSILSGSPAAISNLGTATITSFGPSNAISGAGAVTATVTYK
jgi:hypothetical protein